MPKPKQNHKFLTLLFVVFSLTGILILLMASAGISPPETQLVVIEGTLETIHEDDFERSISINTNYLLTTSGKRYLLDYGREKAPFLRTGATAKVKGLIVGNILETNSADVALTSQGPPAFDPARAQKTSVVIYAFPGTDLAPIVEEGRREVFTKADDFYKEVSFGKASIVGFKDPEGTQDVYAYTVADDKPGKCDSGANEAYSKALADGMSPYYNDLVIWWHPYISGCLSTGGNRVTLNGGWGSALLHEVGHHLTGPSHASSYTCLDSARNIVALSTTCTQSEYGDPFDIMGNKRGVHPNNALKRQAKWIAAGGIQDVTASGIYSIAPQEMPTTKIQGVRLYSRPGAYSGLTKYLYLEFRQPFGYDAFSPPSMPVINGISAREVELDSTGWLQPNTRLLDMTPGSSGNFEDSALAISKCFTDPFTNVTIKTLSISPEEARVRVSFAPIDCTPPTLNITEPQAGYLYTTNSCIKAQYLPFPTAPTFRGEGCVSFNSSDAQSGINKVELYFNNKLINTFSASSADKYTFPLKFGDDTPRIDAPLKLIAFDGEGNFTTKEILVNVLP